jgi:hypothetical protein
MALYTRKDYDLDMEDIERQSQAISRFVVEAGEAGNRSAGLQAIRFEAILERKRNKAKGKLLATRSILADNDAKGACDDRAAHRAGCKCRRLNKFLNKNGAADIHPTEALIAQLEAQLATMA